MCGYSETGVRGSCPSSSNLAVGELWIRYDVVGFGDRVVFNLEMGIDPAKLAADVRICWTNVQDRTEVVCEEAQEIGSHDAEDDTLSITILSTKSDEWFLHLVAKDGAGGDESVVDVDYSLTDSNLDRTEPFLLDLDQNRSKEGKLCLVAGTVCGTPNSNIDRVDAYAIHGWAGDTIEFQMGRRDNDQGLIANHEICVVWRQEYHLSTADNDTKVCLVDFGNYNSNTHIVVVEQQLEHSGYLYIWMWTGNGDIDRDKQSYTIKLNDIDVSNRDLSADLDNDGLPDYEENLCGSDYKDPNDTALDYDQDKTCDLNDSDDDDDGVPDINDACPFSTTSTGADYDGDGCFDDEDLDDDNDGTIDDEDECINGEMNWDSSLSSLDNDADGCRDSTEDEDDDNDGWSDYEEIECETDPLSDSSIPRDWDFDIEFYYEIEYGIVDYSCDLLDPDDDEDGIEDDVDPCQFSTWFEFDFDTYILYELDQDYDTDGCFNEEDDDDDGDGLIDGLDNCPRGLLIGNDLDGDGCVDEEDADIDGDGYSNDDETACGTDAYDSGSVPIGETFDYDGDGICDALDDDDDNDNAQDTEDTFPKNPNEQSDFDGDGIGDNADPDDDNDEVIDDEDAFPYNAAEQYDTDLDGIGNVQDIDDDGDEWLDSKEERCGSDPLNAQSQPLDNDEDGDCDDLDPDDDNDGYDDDVEIACNSDPTSKLSKPDMVDYDSDGVCDKLDTDDDNDKKLDSDDDCVKSDLSLLGSADFNNNGCFDGEEDFDRDGVFDATDDCPTVAADTSNGCKEVTGFAKYQNVVVGGGIFVAICFIVVVLGLGYQKRAGVKDAIEGASKLAELGVTQTYNTSITDNSKKVTLSQMNQQTVNRNKNFSNVLNAEKNSNVVSHGTNFNDTGDENSEL